MPTMLQSLQDPVVVPAWWMLLPLAEPCLGLTCALAAATLFAPLIYLGIIRPPNG